MGLLTYGILVGVQVLLIVALCGGVVFTLDDPYIHLSIAENLRRGVYGVNAGEVSAAASSVLWPLLLVPFPGMTGVAAVLGLSVGAGVFTLMAAARGMREAGAVNGGWIGWILILLIPTLNLVGLVFTGMEHSLHVALTAWTLLGMMRVARGEPAPNWLWVVLALGPLVRYEGLAVTLPALGFLWLRGARRPAAVTGLAVAAALGLFSLFLLVNGLDPLPSSVLVKSGPASGGFQGALRNLLHNLLDRRGVLLSLGAVGFASHALWARSATAWRLFSLSVVAMLGLHLVFGRFGWYNRYEIYAWTVTVLAGLWMALPGPVAGWFARPTRWGRCAAAGWMLALSVFLVPRYWINLATIPLAARNLRRQQMQMRRFALEVVKGPVAVNDLGLASWGNPRYVLDLWGLGNREARMAREDGKGGAWMEDLAARHGVKAVLIYEKWFPERPEEWIRVSKLTQDGPMIVAGGREVSVYARTPEGAERLWSEIPDFAKTLPKGAKLEVFMP